MLRGATRWRGVLCRSVMLAAASVWIIPYGAAADPADRVVDDFLTDGVELALDCDARGPLGTSIDDPNTIGGELDLSARIAFPCADPNAFLFTSVADGWLNFSTAAGAYGVEVEATWDGDDDGGGLEATGLGGVDLTDAGTKDAMLVEVPQRTGSMIFLVRVYTDATHYSTGGGEIDPGSLIVPYVGFVADGPDGGADFSDVGAVQLLASGFGFANNASMSIDSISTTSVVKATMTDALIVDADTDGRASPGDVVEYTVQITNQANQPTGDAHSVEFALTPAPGTELVVGSVTPPSAVTSGNTAGDTSVALALSDLSYGATATATFQVEITDYGDLANQGALTYTVNRTMPPATSWTTTVQTDDPDTLDSFDATITLVVPDPVVANDDTLSTAFGAPVTGNVLTNDTGPSGGLTAAAVTTPTNGTLSLSADGAVTYTPNAGFSGNDTFVYRTTSVLTGATDEATVTITVAAPPSTDPPTTTAPTTVTPPPTTAPPTPPTTPTTLAPTLPATGVDPSDLARIAVLVVALGAALGLGVRRLRLP